ncbi:hypothetical protein VFPFJ_03323 [Purpureocillium lilacinum]|uniref:Uncharacterized protein n=1 Tax=Purpureocillium lilacinum TaxID=33203 RepID=A0A179HQG8_PURLI|nr:hypothetical protein VFPFJ_03323 [Purpureocillium lilacinum]OAQ81528.1 hypothetical protein VFPBJ_04112 [Purpureocillium lilacinum]OAQ91583.1 hypothetical protein VFPFJ_03323 [Purpureocillium lilacinum]
MSAGRDRRDGEFRYVRSYMGLPPGLSGRDMALLTVCGAVRRGRSTQTSTLVRCGADAARDRLPRDGRQRRGKKGKTRAQPCLDSTTNDRLKKAAARRVKPVEPVAGETTDRGVDLGTGDERHDRDGSVFGGQTSDGDSTVSRFVED